VPSVADGKCASSTPGRSQSDYAFIGQDPDAPDNRLRVRILIWSLPTPVCIPLDAYGNAVLEGLPKPDRLVALEYLAMHLALVVIPDLAAWLREHRLLLRLEDAPLRVDEGDAFTFEDDAGLQLGPSQVVVYLAQPSNMVEGVLGGSGCRGLLDPYRHQLRQIDSDKRRAHFKVS